MASEPVHQDPHILAVQLSQQIPHHTMTTAPDRQHQSSMLPPPVPNYPFSSYTLPTQLHPSAPQIQAPAPASTLAQIDPLEQRILDLLYPYRDECFSDEDGTTVTQERNALILCGMYPPHMSHSYLHLTNVHPENIAFLIRHNQSSYGKQVDPSDISVASRNWQIMKQGGGAAGIGVFVNGNGFSHTVVRTTVNPGENTVDRLILQVDLQTQTFFPGI
jgi:hypothetical protein